MQAQMSSLWSNHPNQGLVHLLVSSETTSEEPHRDVCWLGSILPNLIHPISSVRTIVVMVYLILSPLQGQRGDD